MLFRSEYRFSTMSLLIGRSTHHDIDCSRSLTLHLFRVVSRSSTNASDGIGDTHACMGGSHAQVDVATRPCLKSMPSLQSRCVSGCLTCTPLSRQKNLEFTLSRPRHGGLNFHPPTRPSRPQPVFDTIRYGGAVSRWKTGRNRPTWSRPAPRPHRWP